MCARRYRCYQALTCRDWCAISSCARVSVLKSRPGQSEIMFTTGEVRLLRALVRGDSIHLWSGGGGVVGSRIDED